MTALSALAHGTRLNLFRLLVQAGDAGMAAGDIAGKLDVAPSTLSHHLTQLEQAGLIVARRKSRNIFYGIIVENVRALLAYLTEECCAGRPELCGIAAAQADIFSC